MGSKISRVACCSSLLTWAKKPLLWKNNRAHSLGLAGAILGPIVGLLGGILGTRMSIRNTNSPRERRLMVRFAWLTWMLVIVFCGLSLAFTAIACQNSSRHPVLVTSLFLGLALGYFLLLLGLIVWGNRRQRQIRKEESLRSPAESGAPGRQVIMQPFEYRSRRTLLGLPLVHVRLGCDADAKQLPAKGWIAIGNVAYGGLFGCGGFAVAPVSIAGFAVGALALGGGAIGLLSFAGIALGGWSMGGAALGYFADGGVAVAWEAAQGGYAMAHEFAVGGAAFARHANDDAAALAAELALTAVAPIVAALADPANTGKAASTANVKVFPGLVRSRAPSTKASSDSWTSLRPRDRRCFTASSVRSSAAATFSTD